MKKDWKDIQKYSVRKNSKLNVKNSWLKFDWKKDFTILRHWLGKHCVIQLLLDDYKLIQLLKIHFSIKKHVKDQLHKQSSKIVD